MTVQAEERADQQAWPVSKATSLPSKQRRRLPLRWLLVAPASAFVLVVHYVGPGAGAWYALTDWNGIGDPEFIGIQNFREIVTKPATRLALRNTFTLAASFWVLVNLAGLVLAIWLNRALRTTAFLRSVFFLPVIISPVAVAYIWQYIFHYEGPLNSALQMLNLDDWRRIWLADPTWALWCVLVLLVWQYSGLAMVLYLAGLQTIPDELYEAAEVDGASRWFQFRKITFPQLAPAFTIASTLTLILGLRVFDQVIALTSGGPAGATETLATQVYKQTWVHGRFGYGAALAVVLTVVVSVIAIAQVLVLRTREARL